MRTIFLLIVLALTGNAQTSPRGVGYPLIENFRAADYHAAEDNWCAEQDRRGVMFFVNQEGILEYDGVRWDLLRLPDGRYPKSLAADPSGRMYVGSIGDLGYLEPAADGSWRFHSLLPLIPDSCRAFTDVWNILLQPDGVYFSSYEFLFRYHDGVITVIRPLTRFRYIHRMGDLLITDQKANGLCIVRNDSLIPLPGINPPIVSGANIVLPFDDGSYLLGLENELYRYRNGMIERWKTEADPIFRTSRVYGAVRHPNGTIIVNTIGAGIIVMRQDGTVVWHLTHKTGLLSDDVLQVYTDREGGVWAMQMLGISRIRLHEPVEVIDERSGADGYLFHLLDHDDRQYIGTFNGLYVRRPAAAGVPFRKVRSIPMDCRSILPYRGELFVGSFSNTFLLRGEHAVQISKGYVQSFLPSRRDSDVVYVLEDGIHALRRKRGTWTFDGKIPGVVEQINSAVETEEGDLWCESLSDGILHITGLSRGTMHAAVERFGTSRGLPSLRIHGVLLEQGRPIVCVEEGWYRLDRAGKRFEHDEEFESRFHPALTFPATVSVESGRSLWITSADGNGATTMRWYIRQPDGSFRAHASPMEQLRRRELKLIGRGDHGERWFVSGDAFFRYDSACDAQAPEAPAVNLRRVIAIRSVSDTVLFAGAFGGGPGAIVLPLDQTALRIEFAATSFDRSSTMRYRYRLDGLENAWSYWSPKTAKEYTHLPPGSYRFQVQAMDVHGAVGEPAEILLTMPPQWWETGAFRAAVLIVILLLVLAGTRAAVEWRLRRIRRLQRQQEELAQRLIRSQEEERKRIARELHDGLGQDLMVAKNMMQMIIQRTARIPAGMKEKLEELSGVMAGAIDSSRSLLRTIHPYQIERLGLTASLRMMAESVSRTGVHVECTAAAIDGLFPPEQELHLYRIMQEAVTNALKHSGARTIVLTVVRTEASVMMSCADDGTGFDPSAVSGGIGLSGMQERARMLHASFVIAPRTGHGTTITLTVPIP